MKSHKQTPLSRLLEFAQEAKPKIIQSVLFATFGILIGILPYLSVAKLLAVFYTKTASLETVLFWCSIPIVSAIIKMIFTTISTMKSHEAAFSILKSIRIRLTNKMEKVPMGVMLETPSGTLKTMVVDAVDKIEKPLAHIFPEMTANVLTPLTILLILFFIDWRMALVSLITIPVGLIVNMGQMIGYKEKSREYYNSNASMNNAIVEYVNGIEVIKAFNQSASSYEKFTKACTYYRDFTLQWWRGCWFYSATGTAIITSTLTVTLPFGAYLFMNNGIDFAPFITCVILSMGISGPIMAAMNFLDSIANIMEAINQVGDFLDKKELKRPTKRVELDETGYKLQNVRFGYDDKEILHDINIKTFDNGMTAIVGPSGGGKSTIAKLMAGFWDATSGDVIFGGKNIKDIPFEQLMENISFVSQDNYLFDMSIMENIRMGNIKATNNEVISAAKLAGCHDFILNLKDGYNTKVGDAGGKLSGGERQRITIARAILKNSKVIILDEATAYADPENEAEIQKAIAKLVKGKTLIVIAHRLSTIQNADKIIVVEKGNIIAEGTQSYLLKNSPLYKSMWEKHMASNEEVEGCINV